MKFHQGYKTGFNTIVLLCTVLISSCLRSSIDELPAKEILFKDILNCQLLGICPNRGIPLPNFSPPAGLYNSPQTVTIQSDASLICYTTDNSTPTCDSSLSCINGTDLPNPVIINTNTTLRAISCTQENFSSPRTGVYTIDTTPPGQVTGLASSEGDTEIQLFWANPVDSDFAGVMVLRKIGGFPSNPADGDLVFNGNSSSYTDLGRSNGTIYYYSVFTFDLAGNVNLILPAQTSATPMAGAVATPTASPSEGLYNLDQNVSLTSTTIGANICYTVDGSSPSCDSSANCNGSSYLYSSSILINSNPQTLSAIACKVGYFNSDEFTGNYKIDKVAPSQVSSFTASPSDGEIALSWVNPNDSDLAGIIVRRSSSTYPIFPNSDDLVYNGLNNSVIDTSLSNGTTYYYSVFTYDKAGNQNMNPMQAYTTPSAGITNAPTATPPAGLYNTDQNITLSSATAGAMICYTDNSINPVCDATASNCTTGTEATVPISITSTTELKAIACLNGYTDSAIVSRSYTIDKLPPGNVTSLNATPSETKIKLTWQNPTDLDFIGVKVIRKTGSSPTSTSDGTLVYDGGNQTITDTSVANGTMYYYKVFSYDVAGNYSSGSGVNSVPNPPGGPTFSPPPGTYNTAQSVQIQTTGSFSSVCYTTNGTTPKCGALLVCINGQSTPSTVNISSTTTLKVVQCSLSVFGTDESSANYTIGP